MKILFKILSQLLLIWIKLMMYDLYPRPSPPLLLFPPYSGIWPDLQETLAKVKQKMDINFSKNRILPNDPNFEWDKQVDFQPPQEACDWDEEEDD